METTSPKWQANQEKGEAMLSLLGKPSVPFTKKVVVNYIVCIVFIFGVAFCSISFRTKAISMGYQIGELQHKKRDVENIQRCLKIESARLKSLERIEDIAREMGLGTPERIEIVYIPANLSDQHQGAQRSILIRCYQSVVQLLKSKRQGDVVEADVINKD